MITRVPPGTWETLSFPSSTAAEIPPTNSRLIHGSASGAGGTNNGRNDGIAKRRKRRAAKWAAGSRSIS